MTFSYFYIASMLFVALRIGDFQFNRRIRRIRRAQGNKTSHCQSVGLPWMRSGHVRGGVDKLIGRFAANSIYDAKIFALFSLF